MSDEIEEASNGAHYWKGTKLFPFSWEHEVAFDQFLVRGAALYNAQLMLWMLTTPPERIERLQGTPERVPALVKEFAQENKLRMGSDAMKLANSICSRILDEIKVSETDPIIEDTSGAPGPK